MCSRCRTPSRRSSRTSLPSRRRTTGRRRHETLAEIRHGYVHSNKKRRQVVLSAPNLATFEAWQLSLWYQELALLYLLGHHGEYRNRLTAEWLGQVERVPWV